MAAIEGFEVSLSTGDLVVEPGLINGIAVAGASLDGAALGDGVAYAITDGAGAALSLIEDQNLAAGEVVVASCTIATGACTLESLADRGKEADVSASF